MATSIFSRKRDLLYLIYFSSAIPMAFIADLQPLYPQHLIPPWMASITDYYIKTFHDQFFIEAPPFFEFFMWTEALIQVPTMIWGIGALLRDSPMLPLVLLPFSVVVALSTATCIFALAHWDAPFSQKRDLGLLYAPYVVLPVVIGIDMFFRLKETIRKVSTPSAARVKKVQ